MTQLPDPDSRARSGNGDLTDLQTEQAELTAEIIELKRGRARAVLDGKMNGALSGVEERLAAARAELECAEDVSEERYRRERAIQLETTAKQRADRRGAIAEGAEERAKAVRLAEEHARAFSEALSQITKIDFGIRSHARALGRQAHTSDLECEKRISRRLAALLQAASSLKHRPAFGIFTWWSAGVRDGDWAESEQAAIGPRIASLIENDDVLELPLSQPKKEHQPDA